MFNPQAIGYLLAIETAYAISLAFGVGEVATGLLLVAGVVFVGQELLVLIEEGAGRLCRRGLRRPHQRGPGPGC